MTGSGTATDPYVPTTWQEFLTALGTIGAYVSVPEGTVWDMNEIQPNGINSEIVIGARLVEGNGLIIDNLVLTGGGCFTYNGAVYTNTNLGTHYPQPFRDITFSNMLIESGACFFKHPKDSAAADWMYPSIWNCRFSGKIVDSLFMWHYNDSPNNQTLQLVNSSLNLEMSGNSTFIYAQSSGFAISVILSNCNIMISGAMPRSANSVRLRIINCLIRGDWAVNGLYIGISAAASEYCIFDVNIPSGYALSTQYPAKINKCLINSDKISGSADSAFTRVTSEQLRDAEYLLSIGFPIATGA